MIFTDSNQVLCATSSRPFQNMSLFYGDTRESLNNRKNFLSILGIDYRDLVCTEQVHASSVAYVKEEDRGCGALSYESAIADTDALVTDKKNLPLAVFTADCLSIFLYDPFKPAIGLIHAGWRTTRENITGKTIRLMQKQFNSKGANLYVSFGPAIRGCCYKIGEDFNNFSPGDIIKRNGHHYLDLVQMNKTQVLDLTVKESHIFDSEICTFCRNDEFFSYRKEGKACGRMMSVIMLK